MRPAAAPAPTVDNRGGVQHLESLRLSWCSDCRDDRLFETVAEGAVGVTALDWACTACGAAYLDGIDVVLIPS
jgi:hypothetical protein